MSLAKPGDLRTRLTAVVSVVVMSSFVMGLLPGSANYAHAGSRRDVQVKRLDPCFSEIQRRYIKQRKKNIAIASAQFLASGAFFAAGVGAHFIPVPVVGAAIAIPLTMTGSTLMGKGIGKAWRLFGKRSPELGKGGPRLLIDLSYASQLKLVSERPLDDSAPIFVLKRLDSEGKRKAKNYQLSIQKFVNELNRKYVNVMRIPGEGTENIPYITPYDVVRFFVDGIKDRSLCSPEFFNSFEKGSDFFLAGRIVASRLDSTTAEERKGIDYHEFAAPPKPGLFEQGGLIVGAAERWLDKKDLKRETLRKTLSAAGTTVVPSEVSAESAEEPAAVQGNACTAQLKEEYMARVKRSGVVGAAVLTSAVMTGTVAGTCAGAFAPSPADLILQPLFFTSSDVLDAKGLSAFNTFFKHMLGKVPFRLPIEADEGEIKNMAIVATLTKDVYVNKPEQGWQSRFRQYDRYEDYLNALSERLNEKFDTSTCNVYLTKSRPSKSSHFPAMWPIGRKIFYAGKKGETMRQVQADEDLGLDALSFKGKFTHLSAEQCSAVKGERTYNDDGITSESLRAFLKDGVESGLVCKSEFSAGIRTGGHAYLASTVSLYSKLKKRRNGEEFKPSAPVVKEESKSRRKRSKTLAMRSDRR